MTRKKRVGVLISGRGSNLQALINACKKRDYPAEIVLVISNVPQAQGSAARGSSAHPHAHHRPQGLPHRAKPSTLRSTRRSTRPASSFSATRASCGCIRAGFVESWRDRHLNIHPSLLPAFRGLHTHERVIAAGCKISGCTVHFVRAEMDEGPIVAQAAVPVLARRHRRDAGGCGCWKPSIAFILMRLRSSPQARSRVEGERVVDANDQAQVAAFFAAARLSGVRRGTLIEIINGGGIMV